MACDECSAGIRTSAHRAATPLELLFDLTFVVSFAQAGDQLAHYVAEGHIATAVWGFSFVLLSVCWAWINFTWFASAFDTDDWLQRILTMVQMVGVIVLALGIPAVFESIDSGEPFDFVVVAVGYVIMRVSLVLMWLRVARQDPANRRVALRYAVYNVLIQAGWLTVALLRIEDTAILVALLVILWVAEFAGHPFATWNAKDDDDHWLGTPWNARHISERYGLLVMITLGEGILGTIAAVAAVVSRVGWSGEAILIVVAGTGLTFGLWSTYFILPPLPCWPRTASASRRPATAASSCSARSPRLTRRERRNPEASTQRGRLSARCRFRTPSCRRCWDVKRVG